MVFQHVLFRICSTLGDRVNEEFLMCEGTLEKSWTKVTVKRCECVHYRLSSDVSQPCCWCAQQLRVSHVSSTGITKHTRLQHGIRFRHYGKGNRCPALTPQQLHIFTRSTRCQHTEHGESELSKAACQVPALQLLVQR